MSPEPCVECGDATLARLGPVALCPTCYDYVWNTAGAFIVSVELRRQREEAERKP